LRSLIEHDAHTLDEVTQKRFQKLLNATQTFIAECALLQDDNELLSKQNDEAKRRRSTKSTILGKAKVMSYEDLELAKTKRAAKEATTNTVATKGKRGRKPKNSEQETAKTKKQRKTEVEVARDEISAGGLEDYCSVLQF
jgi:hypothetical protein